jgi:superfamily I DNA/RNA helicase
MTSPDLPVAEYPGDALRVFGPPGTGKTTYLADRVRATVQEHGADSIMIASFSVTAAKEIGSRFAHLGPGNRPDDKLIGTLHSHAFRAIRHPSVALDRKIIPDWNESAPPEWAITPDMRRTGGDTGAAFTGDPSAAATGDELISALDKLRATRTAPEDWPTNVRNFSARWEAWKAANGAVDYTDMIAGALERARDGEPAPGRPQYLVVDEAQDLTPLEFELALAWGQKARKLIVGLDDDQAINRWRGGDPEPLLALHGPHVADHLLAKSHRVPESVRAAAEQWVRYLGPRRRDKVYGSRTDEGGAVVVGAAFHVPTRLADARLVGQAVAEVDKGNTVMIMAACNYMLEPLIKNLRKEGVPFHNPFRPGELRWNPLGKTQEGTTSTAERVAAFLALEERDWTGSDVQTWLDLIKLKEAGMRNGAKARAAQFGPHDPVPFEEIAALFATDEALTRATEPDLDWLARSLLADRRKVAEYPIHIARIHGAAALARKPRIAVGTIHSFKGATADIVYVCPDVSAAAARSMAQQPGVDETIRQFYVAMTRAFKELRVLTPSGGKHVKPAQLIPSVLEVHP